MEKQKPMAPDMNHIPCKAGYAGHDAMRERAIREFAGEYKNLMKGYDRPLSWSAQAKTPLRKY